MRATLSIAAIFLAFAACRSYENDFNEKQFWDEQREDLSRHGHKPDPETGMYDSGPLFGHNAVMGEREGDAFERRTSSGPPMEDFTQEKLLMQNFHAENKHDKVPMDDSVHGQHNIPPPEGTKGMSDVLLQENSKEKADSKEDHQANTDLRATKQLDRETKIKEVDAKVAEANKAYKASKAKGEKSDKSGSEELVQEPEKAAETDAKRAAKVKELDEKVAAKNKAFLASNKGKDVEEGKGTHETRRDEDDATPDDLVEEPEKAMGKAKYDAKVKEVDAAVAKLNKAYDLIDAKDTPSEAPKDPKETSPPSPKDPTDVPKHPKATATEEDKKADAEDNAPVKPEEKKDKKQIDAEVAEANKALLASKKDTKKSEELVQKPTKVEDTKELDAKVAAKNKAFDTKKSTEKIPKEDAKKSAPSEAKATPQDAKATEKTPEKNEKDSAKAEKDSAKADKAMKDPKGDAAKSHLPKAAWTEVKEPNKTEHKVSTK